MKIYRNDSSAVNGANVWHAPKSNNKKVVMPADQVKLYRPELDPMGAKFRVPSNASIAEMKKQGVEIDEHIIRKKVAVLLERMAAENQLNIEPVIPELARSLFAGNKKIDLAAYNALFNTNQKEAPDLSQKKAELVIKDKAENNQLNPVILVDQLLKRFFPEGKDMDLNALPRLLKARDQSTIYGAVLDAHSRLNRADAGKIRSSLLKAAARCRESAKNNELLTAVFGTKAGKAATIYNSISEKLKMLYRDIDKKITVDYNGDAAQMGVSGYALYQQERVHLMAAIASGQDDVETEMTLIHEAAHLVSNDIGDRGYYNSPGFLYEQEEVKIRNAAHFEEVPRRLVGKSSYATDTFKPNPLQPEAQQNQSADDMRIIISQTVERLWRKSADVHDILTTIRLQQHEKNNSSMEKFEGQLKNFSKGFGLTLHEQDNDPIVITGLDVALIEGVVHAFHLVKPYIHTMPLVQKPGWTRYDIAKESILQALSRQKMPYSDPEQNRRLYNWIDNNLDEIATVNKGVVLRIDAK